MPTFKICVFEHQQRKDGRFRVSVQLTHQRKRAYIKTDTYVVRKQISSDFKTLRDADTARRIDREILEYEKLLLRGLGANLSQYTAKDLAEYIETQAATNGGAGIDFVAFARGYIANLKREGRKSYAESFEAVIRALIDFFGRETIYVREVTSKNLSKFVDRMQTTRTMTRINQHGKEYTIKRPAASEQTVADYLRRLQTLFNAARDHYNGEDDDMAIITHNPFRKRLVKVTEEPEKRDLSVEDLVKIIRYEGATGKVEFARDVFLMSFYLIGINTADLFGVETSALADGRLTYNRKKTATRRKDEALMSVRIEPEVSALVEKYRNPGNGKAFTFYQRYATHRTFNAAVNKGLKMLAEALEINVPLSTYYARHTVATIAYNHCGFSETEIGMALNHVGMDSSLKVTRGYINRDWSRIDHFNRTVLDFVAGKVQE